MHSSGLIRIDTISINIFIINAIKTFLLSSSRVFFSKGIFIFIILYHLCYLMFITILIINMSSPLFVIYRMYSLIYV